jgi:hypothetical protein
MNLNLVGFDNDAANRVEWNTIAPLPDLVQITDDGTIRIVGVDLGHPHDRGISTPALSAPPCKYR